jgi:tetratricopeptide (TPR) repeat protein
MNFFPNLFGGAAAVAHTAHIAGTLYGFSVCMALLFTRLLPRDQFDILALGQRWNRRRQYRSMVSQGFDPFGRTPATLGDPSAPDPDDPRSRQVAELRGDIADAIARHDHAAAAALYRRLHALDPRQVLSRIAQLDIANQLAHEQDHAAAAEAYEQFLSAYPKYEQVEQVELMLGVIYARYLSRPDQAREHLSRALRRLHRAGEIELAQAELDRLAAPAAPPPAPRPLREEYRDHE